MAGLVPAIHVFFGSRKDVDGRDKHGHDEKRVDDTNHALAIAGTSAFRLHVIQAELLYQLALRT
jgi:hypothetical protein